MAVFLVRQREAVHIVTDGAAVGNDGKVAGVVAKIMPLPHLYAAVALRGDVEMVAQLPLLGRAHDLVNLRQLAEQAVRATREAGREVELYIAALGGCFAVTAGGTTDIESFALAPADQAIYAELSFLYGRTADQVDAEVEPPLGAALISRTFSSTFPVRAPESEGLEFVHRTFTSGPTDV